ncbi:MAG: hypothetical protein OES46_17705 [Gammaproteobacteria bacterium]|nr:hypothetical protein [Gammaproteobacteria bacterium]
MHAWCDPDKRYGDTRPLSHRAKILHAYTKQYGVGDKASQEIADKRHLFGDMWIRLIAGGYRPRCRRR